MMDVCAYVLQIIGGDLSAISAQSLRSVHYEHETACVFVAKGRKVAIPWSIQNGLTCYITDELDADDTTFRSWGSLWSTDVVEHPDDLKAYLDQFPIGDDKDDNDLLRFIGKKLKEHLAA